MGTRSAWVDGVVEQVVETLLDLKPAYRRVHPVRFRARVRQHFLRAFPTIDNAVAREGREGVVETGIGTPALVPPPAR